MRLPLLFAGRYLFSRKSHAIINIISVISSLTVAVPVMAMVILLSVFNGFESLVKSMYGNFDPDIAVTPVSGKTFERDDLPGDELLALESVAAASFVYEENALLEYRENQVLGTLLGVDENYRQVIPIDEMVVRGEFAPKFGDLDQALIGAGMAWNLSAGVNLLDPLTVYLPRKGRPVSLLPVNMYRKKEVFISGYFALDGETDGKYAIVPIDFVRELAEAGPSRASSVLVKLAEGADPAAARKAIRELLGDDFEVKTRYQQKADLYRLMKYEKWGIYFIILMVLVIASFSIVGSLVMIMVDKSKDMDTLATIGAEKRLIRKIFVWEGMMISGIGILLGLLSGVALCLLQQRYGFIRMAGTSFLVDAYPVILRLTDLLWIVASVLTVAFAISALTVRSMGKTPKTS